MLAAANRAVIEDPAIAVQATGLRTGIDALVVHAGSVRGALRAYHALGSTSRWRTYVLWQTGAHCLPVVLSADAVGPAG